MEDLMMEVETVTERIKLIRKQLSNVMRKKSKLLKQLTELDKLAAELEVKLNEETRREQTHSNIIIKQEGTELNSTMFTVAHAQSTRRSKRIWSKKKNVASIAADMFLDSSESVGDNTEKTSRSCGLSDNIVDTSLVSQSVICSGAEADLVVNDSFLLLNFVQPKSEGVLADLPGDIQLCSGSGTSTYLSSSVKPRRLLPQPQMGDHDNIQLSITPKRRRKSYFCQVCNKDLLTCDRYRKHMVQHTNDRPFECTTCGKFFALRHLLTNHSKLHIIGMSSELCTVCGKSYANLHSLQQHMLRHDEKKFVCEVCGRKFVLQRECDAHRLIHTGEFLYICNVCGRGLRSKRAHDVHLITHSEFKMYECKICLKKFHFSSYLDAHMRTHTSEKALVCKICRESFANSYNLKVHRAKVHAGMCIQRIYPCNLCNKTFVLVGNLKAHLVSHSSESHHKCDECNKQYKHAIDLRKHKIKIHTHSH